MLSFLLSELYKKQFINGLKGSLERGSTINLRMKKLGKLKLNNFSEMSEQEMKFVIGGQYDPNAKKACHETAPTCGGVCAPAFIYASDGTLTTVTKTCTVTYDLVTHAKICACL